MMKEKRILSIRRVLVFIMVLAFILPVYAFVIKVDTATAGLAVDFGTSGLYSNDSSGGWSKLSSVNAQWLGTYNGKLVGDFGAYGLYEYDGAAWTRIAFANADNSGNTMVAYDGGLAVDVGTGGLWYYKNGNWTQISTANPQWLKSYNDYFFDMDTLNNIPIPRIAVDFGVYGLWRYGGGTDWTKLTSGDPDNSDNTMVGYSRYRSGGIGLYFAYGGLTVDFGVSGLWYYEQNQGWKKLSSANPQWMETDDHIYGVDSNYMFIDFGASGLYRYDNAAEDYGVDPWDYLSTADADNSGNTMTDW